MSADKLYSASDAHSPGPRGSWSASSSTVRRATPTQEYNLSLAEMRHYKDQDTMVLVLSQNSDPAEEAEYPVPMEQDTSELLDAEGTRVAVSAIRLLPHKSCTSGPSQTSLMKSHSGRSVI